jgi:hypothetical protein
MPLPSPSHRPMPLMTKRWPNAGQTLVKCRLSQAETLLTNNLEAATKSLGARPTPCTCYTPGSRRGRGPNAATEGRCLQQQRPHQVMAAYIVMPCIGDISRQISPGLDQR